MAATAGVDRERALPLALALLAVVSLAVAAATIDSAVVTDGASGVGGDDEGFGNERRDSGNRTGANVSAGGAGRPLPLSPCAPFLREPPVLLTAGVLLVGLFAAAYRSTRSSFASAVVVGGVAFPLGLVWAAVAFCPQLSGGSQNVTRGIPNGSYGPVGGSGGLAETGRGALASPTLLVLLLTVVAVGVVAVAVYASGRDDGDVDDDVETPEPPDDDATGEIGRVAGLAADRIDETGDGIENEVYRAWREMADSLEVASPETTTPREFQRAAVDGGMADDDVEALTSLFEAVRYGDREATEATERRAVETLRRIESSYGGE